MSFMWIIVSKITSVFKVSREYHVQKPLNVFNSLEFQIFKSVQKLYENNQITLKSVLHK